MTIGQMDQMRLYGLKKFDKISHEQTATAEYCKLALLRTNVFDVHAAKKYVFFSNTTMYI